MLDYLAVGIVYADYALFSNMFMHKEEMGYDETPFWLKFIAYFTDILLWPLGLMWDLYRKN